MNHQESIQTILERQPVNRYPVDTWHTGEEAKR